LFPEQSAGCGGAEQRPIAQPTDAATGSSLNRYNSNLNSEYWQSTMLQVLARSLLICIVARHDLGGGSGHAFDLIAIGFQPGQLACFRG
jgi:hypothetical protein